MVDPTIKIGMAYRIFQILTWMGMASKMMRTPSYLIRICTVIPIQTVSMIDTTRTTIMTD